MEILRIKCMRRIPNVIYPYKRGQRNNNNNNNHHVQTTTTTKTLSRTTACAHGPGETERARGWPPNYYYFFEKKKKQNKIITVFSVHYTMHGVPLYIINIILYITVIATFLPCF